MNLISNVNDTQLEGFSLFLHPDEKEFIGYYKEAAYDAIAGEDCAKEQFNDYTRYTYEWETEGVNYLEEQMLNIDSDMWMNYESTIYWDNGDRRDVEFYRVFFLL